MERKFQNISNSDSEDHQVSAQLFNDNIWSFKSFNLEESSSFIPKQSFEIYEYNDIDSQIFQNFHFQNQYNYLQLNASLDIISPKTEEGQSFQPQLKEGHQSSQNMESFYLQVQNQQKDYQASYHRGHIQFLRQLKTPIFMQSRKFCKSKKKMKRGKTYYQFIATYMKGYVSNSCKRFDQYHLQQSFKNMDNREQQKRQATLQAIRHLKKYKNNSENKRLLEKHRQIYSTSRKWAIFLDNFVNKQN